MTARATGWIADADSRVEALIPVGDSLLYVGGLFSTIAGARRSGLAALDIATGAVAHWDPDPGGGVSTIVNCENTLYVGGGFTRADGAPSAGLAAFSLLPPAPEPKPMSGVVLLLPIRPNPVRASATIRFALPSAGAVDLAIFDILGRQVSSLLRRTPLPAGVHDVTLHADQWPGGFYFVRLEVAGKSATRKLVVVR
jgi:hypothetical protein